MEGAGNRNGITAGTKTVQTRNPELTVISETKEDIETGLTLGGWIASDLDNKGRPQRTDYSDGTDAITQYTCCGLGFTRDRSGATTAYSRDILKRAYRIVSKRSSTGPEVATSTAINGLTTIASTTSGGSTLFVSESTRNLAGDTVTSKSPDANGDGSPETTTIATTYPAGGGKTVTTTYPDGSTSIRTSFADGEPLSVSGSANPAMTYDHDTHALNGGGIVQKTTAANGTQWQKTYADQLGRTFRTEFPDAAASTVAHHPFSAAPGSRGKPASSTDPDGITVTYAYNAEGERKLTTEPMPNGQQRITATDSDVINDPDLGVSYRSTQTINGILVSTSLRDSHGYASKSVTLAGTTTSRRTVPADGAWMVTTTSPDGVLSRAFYSDGLLKATVLFEAGSSLPSSIPANITAMTDTGFISGSSTTQDGFGRTLTTTDSRTGTTTMGTYLANGSLLSVTDPGSRTTAFAYDVMGRKIKTTLPDGSATHTTYTARGEVAATYGSQTYPTFRTYDALGRQSTLRTQPSLDSNGVPTDAGGSVTQWHYDSQRGFLTGKRDAADKGADYTYTPAGRLATRTWARGVTTSYTYDAGLLTLTDYSDATPDVTQFYDNFGRPVETSNTVSKSTYTYDPATLAIDTETISYDLDQNGTPDFTRVLDRSRDSLLRDTGFQLKNGSTLENQAAYAYSATDGRLSQISNPQILKSPI